MKILSRMLAQIVYHAREEDKQLHFVWSFWMMIWARVLWSEPWALAFVLTIGVAKEVWDARFGSGFSTMDLVANTLGCVAATCLVRALASPVFEA